MYFFKRFFNEIIIQSILYNKIDKFEYNFNENEILFFCPYERKTKIRYLLNQRSKKFQNLPERVFRWAQRCGKNRVPKKR